MVQSTAHCLCIDPQTRIEDVSSDEGSLFLIRMAARYAALPQDGKPRASLEVLVAEATATFRHALELALLESPEVLKASCTEGFCVQPLPEVTP